MSGKQLPRVTRAEAKDQIEHGVPKDEAWIYEPGCCTCRHWLRGDGVRYARQDMHDREVCESWGACVLEPAWVLAHARHFCSRHEDRAGGGGIYGSLLRDTEQLDDRAERLRLAKANKALRAELRQMKARKP